MIKRPCASSMILKLRKDKKRRETLRNHGLWYNLPRRCHGPVLFLLIHEQILITSIALDMRPRLYSSCRANAEGRENGQRHGPLPFVNVIYPRGNISSLEGRSLLSETRRKNKGRWLHKFRSWLKLNLGLKRHNLIQFPNWWQVCEKS